MTYVSVKATEGRVAIASHGGSISHNRYGREYQDTHMRRLIASGDVTVEPPKKVATPKPPKPTPAKVDTPIWDPKPEEEPK